MVGGIRNVLTWRLSDWKRGTWWAKKAKPFSDLSEFYTGKKILSIENQPNFQLDIFSFFFLQRPTLRLNSAVLVYALISVLSLFVHWKCCGVFKSHIVPTHLKTKNLPGICLGMFQVSETDFWKTRPPDTVQKKSHQNPKIECRNSKYPSCFIVPFPNHHVWYPD